MTVADRWFYFPLVGLLGIIGVSFDNVNFLNKKKTILSCLAILTIALLSVRTIIRNTNWIDALTLYNHDSKIYDNHEIENNLGFEYYSIGNNTDALKHFKASIKLFPYETNLSNAALTYNKLGNYQEEVKYNYLALQSKSYLEIDHKHSMSTYIRALRLLLFLNRPEEAKKIAKTGLQDYPNYYLLWVYLAISEYELKNQTEALAAAEKVKMLVPSEEANYLYNQILTGQSIPTSQLTP